MKLKSPIYRVLLCIAFVCFTKSYLCSQTLGVSAGVGITSLVNFSNDHSFGISDHGYGNNQFLKVDFEEYLPEAPFLGFYMIYERSSVSVVANNMLPMCGMGIFPTNTNFHHRINYHRLGLGFSPMKVQVYKQIKIKSGIELSRILKYNLAPLRNENRLSSPFFPAEDIDSVINSFGLGTFLELYIGELNLNNSFYLTPFYRGSISISEEFDTIFNTKTMRHSFGVSIKTKLLARN